MRNLEIYWIDRQGGRHYHKKDCQMVTGYPHYNYEPIKRRKRRIPSYLTRIREGGKYYNPCPGCFGKPR